MNRLQLPHAKLFYMIAQLSKKQFINDTEKRVLKEKTMDDDAQIFQLLSKYQASQDEDQLAEDLIKLAHNAPLLVLVKEGDLDKSQPDTENRQDEPGSALNLQPEITSPVGAQLHRRKVQNSHNLNNEISRLILEPHTVEQTDDNSDSLIPQTLGE